MPGVNTKTYLTTYLHNSWFDPTYPMRVPHTHWLICLKNHFRTYFHAPGVKQGVKTSEKLQGTQISRFGALKFSQNWRIFKNVQNSTKNPCFGAVFQSLFNFGWILADQTKKFKFLEGFCFLWHPAWPQGRESKGNITVYTICFEIWEQWHPLRFFPFLQSKP